MSPVADIHEINEKIIKVKDLLLELKRDADAFPALEKNSKRALASVKMLELNICDMIAFDLIEP